MATFIDSNNKKVTYTSLDDRQAGKLLTLIAKGAEIKKREEDGETRKAGLIRETRFEGAFGRSKPDNVYFTSILETLDRLILAEQGLTEEEAALYEMQSDIGKRNHEPLIFDIDGSNSVFRGLEILDIRTGLQSRYYAEALAHYLFKSEELKKYPEIISDTGELFPYLPYLLQTFKYNKVESIKLLHKLKTNGANVKVDIDESLTIPMMAIHPEWREELVKISFNTIYELISSLGYEYEYPRSRLIGSDFFSHVVRLLKLEQNVDNIPTKMLEGMILYGIRRGKLQKAYNRIMKHYNTIKEQGEKEEHRADSEEQALSSSDKQYIFIVSAFHNKLSTHEIEVNKILIYVLFTRLMEYAKGKPWEGIEEREFIGAGGVHKVVPIGLNVDSILTIAHKDAYYAYKADWDRLMHSIKVDTILELYEYISNGNFGKCVITAALDAFLITPIDNLEEDIKSGKVSRLAVEISVNYRAYMIALEFLQSNGFRILTEKCYKSSPDGQKRFQKLSIIYGGQEWYYDITFEELLNALGMSKSILEMYTYKDRKVLTLITDFNAGALLENDQDFSVILSQAKQVSLFINTMKEVGLAERLSFNYDFLYRNMSILSKSVPVEL